MIYPGCFVRGRTPRFFMPWGWAFGQEPSRSERTRCIRPSGHPWGSPSWLNPCSMTNWFYSPLLDSSKIQPKRYHILYIYIYCRYNIISLHLIQNIYIYLSLSLTPISPSLDVLSQARPQCISRWLDIPSLTSPCASSRLGPMFPGAPVMLVGF